MPVAIFNKPFNITLYGLSGKVLNKDYTTTRNRLMDPMWQEIKSKGIKNKGINYWVYEKEMFFCGVELDEQVPAGCNLVMKEVNLSKYAYLKHTGPYVKLKNAYAAMHRELEKRKIVFHFPLVEIYGHWTEDETKLETELVYEVD
jgi:effector-binding domain-containing protein